MFTHRTIEVAYKNFINIFNKALNSSIPLKAYAKVDRVYSINLSLCYETKYAVKKTLDYICAL